MITNGTKSSSQKSGMKCKKVRKLARIKFISRISKIIAKDQRI